MPTQADDELALLKHTIMQGWSILIKQIPQVLQPYCTFRQELTVEDGLILKGTRIVIPAKKHEAKLKLIDEGQLGLNKCKLHTKDTVYWPGLNDQLEKPVLKCELCLFLVVCKLTSMTGQHRVTQCKLILSKYGWPETGISDNR